MVTHLVKDILKKVYVKRDGRKYQHGNVFTRSTSSNYSYRSLWMIENGWKEAAHGFLVENFGKKTSTLKI